MEEKDREKIKKDVQKSFDERIRNTIGEKISYCVKSGMTEDEAQHTVIQVVKNISDNFVLFPMKFKKAINNNEWS